MIETRESFQPLLKKRSPPTSPGKRMKKQVEVASYGTLKGEALLHADNNPASFSKPTNGPASRGNGATPQSAEFGQYAEYMQPLPKIQQSTSNGTARLPPAIPLRRRAESSGDRSAGELSTVSGTSGANRLQRSSSDGHDVHAAGDSLSPTYGRQPQPPQRSRSANPKPPRSRSPAPNAGFVPIGGHPLQHRRRSSDERSFSSEGRHRRTHSCDVPREQMRRQNSSSSLYSLNSQGSMNSESMKLLPDPRWGFGGSGGGRGRSFSGGSQNMMHREESSSYVNVSYSTDSFDGKQRPFGYGSVGSEKEVIMNGNVGEVSRSHRRNNSEISTSTYASATSIDKSVDPVMTDMTKSSMFKGLTNEGVVRLQLPKDNFRLLSDRDLESGCVYKRALVDNEDDYFLDYHIVTTDDAAPFPPPTADCQCCCPNCENCHGRRKQLPPSYYVMAVDSDIYRRMFDEVAESMNMPCKLFYCGHHEDVDYPSIGIAAVGVASIFVVMLWATIVVDG